MQPKKNFRINCFWKGNKRAVTVIHVGGPDRTPKSTPNLINFVRLWRDFNLDILILSSYAQGHSHHNPIERRWALLSKWLTGVTRLIALKGKSSPREHFAGLSESEIPQGKLRFWMRCAASTGLILGRFFSSSGQLH